MKNNHPAHLDQIWNTTKYEYINAIEEIIEESPTTALTLSFRLNLPMKRTLKYIGEMKKNKMIESVESVKLNGVPAKLWRIYQETLEQPSLIRDPVKRDPLVEALFGPAKS
jgi:hypothetical protein